MKLLFIFSMLLIGNFSFGQTENYPQLILGSWSYVGTIEGSFELDKNGQFKMNWYEPNKPAIFSEGTYTIENNKLVLTYPENGGTTKWEIELLDDDFLRIRYIETVYTYQRIST